MTFHSVSLKKNCRRFHFQILIPIGLVWRGAKLIHLVIRRTHFLIHYPMDLTAARRDCVYPENAWYR